MAVLRFRYVSRFYTENIYFVARKYLILQSSSKMSLKVLLFN